MRHPVLLMLVIWVAGCSSSYTTTEHIVNHPEVTKVTTEQIDPETKELVVRVTQEKTPAHTEIKKSVSESRQIFTEHGTSADTDAENATANNKRQPKSKEEIRAESAAKFNSWMGVIGVALMVSALLMFAAKMYLRATAGVFAEIIVSMPIWFIGVVGLIGSGMFGWATLGVRNQQLLAGLMVVGIVVVVWLSWRSNHKSVKQIKGKQNEQTT
jgi:cation transport ATPase